MKLSPERVAEDQSELAEAFGQSQSNLESYLAMQQTGWMEKQALHNIPHKFFLLAQITHLPFVESTQFSHISA